MLFKIQVSSESSKWWETYTKDIEDADAYGKEIIERFNLTLRPGEKPREFIQSIIIDASVTEHTEEMLDCICGECEDAISTKEWRNGDGLCNYCIDNGY